MSSNLSLFHDTNLRSAATHAVDYLHVTHPSQVDVVLKMFATAPTLALDLEFDGLNAWFSRPLLWQISDGYHHVAGESQKVPLHLIRPLLETRPIIAHNGVTEYKHCLVSGVELRQIIDPMIAYRVLKAGLLEGPAKRSSGLASVLKQYLDVDVIKDTRKEFIGHSGLAFTREQLDYSVLDVVFLHALWEKMRDEALQKELYDTILFEFSLIPSFGCAELNGMPAMKDPWNTFLKETVESELDKLQAVCEPILIMGLNKLHDEKPDIAITKKSSKKKKAPKTKASKEELGQIELLAVPIDHVKLTSRQQIMDAFKGFGISIDSTEKEVLKNLLDEKLPEEAKDLTESLLALSIYQKLYNAFGYNVSSRITDDGVLYTELDQTGASATGRGSSKNPNLQQIPARGELGSKFREFFTLPETSDRCMVIADYSALEQRIAAHYTGDPVMHQIFRDGLDIHGFVASKMFGLSWEEFERLGEYDRTTGEYGNKKAVLSNGLTIKYMRDEITKTCSFAANYGGGATTLGRSLKGKTKDELEEIFNTYTQTLHVLFSRLAVYGHQAIAQGYTKNLSGRKRFYYPTNDLDHPAIFHQRSRVDKERRNKLGTEVDGELYTQWHLEREQNAERESIRRQGLNHPVQSLAADIMKLAMRMITDELRARGLFKVFGPQGTALFSHVPGGSICNQIHDELVLITDACVAETIAEVVERNMLEAERQFIPTVPPGCTCHIGMSWANK